MSYRGFGDPLDSFFGEGGERKMWQLKGCARCGGDVYINRDEYGWYVQCLQCGYHSELVNIEEARKQMPKETEEVTAEANLNQNA